MAEKYVTPEQHHAMRNQSSQQKNFSKPLLAVVIIIFAVVLSFFGGMQYQKNHQKAIASTAGGAANGQTGAGFGAGGRFGGQRPTRGQVTAVGASSITVQNQAGTSITLAITSSTMISDNGQTVTASDIKVGDTVAVIASTSDSTQASRILVNPSFGGGQQGGSAPASPQTITQ